MSDTMKKAGGIIGKYKYPLIVLVVGVFIMLLPTGNKHSQATDEIPEAGRDVERMEYVLSGVEGVGQVRALMSENGVVIVCAGADDAQARLELTQAVKSYTGFGSDRITILKIQDRYIGEETK